MAQTTLKVYLSIEQKKELNARIKSFHKNPSIGKSWTEIKTQLSS